MKLSEYQNQIYKNNKNILELYEKNLVLKKEAAQSIKNKDEATAKKLGVEISKNSLKASDLENNNVDLVSKLKERQSILAQKKESANAREEIEAHSKLAAQHERERQKEAQAKKQKQEETYKSEKTKLYNSASNFIGDPVSLNNILTPSISYDCVWFQK